MKPFLKFGLIVGGLAMLVVIPVAALFGICVPLIAAIAGAAAGYLAVSSDKTLPKADGVKTGAMAGGISGACTLIGQVIGGVAVMVIVQVTGTKLAFGSVPSASSEPIELITYYAAGVGTVCCLGIVGLALGAGAGALAGLLVSRKGSTPAATPPPAPLAQ
jgi:hypothetical protein